MNRNRVTFFHAGYKFYFPCGWLYFSNDTHDTTLQGLQKEVEKVDQSVTVLSNEQLKSKYPYLDVPALTTGVFLKHGGYINPRVLHKAQQQIAMNHGCQIFDAVVDSIHQEPSGHHILITNSGKQISTQKVLLATGAFTECRNLLRPGVSPAMDSTAETVLFVSINDH